MRGHEEHLPRLWAPASFSKMQQVLFQGLPACSLDQPPILEERPWILFTLSPLCPTPFGRGPGTESMLMEGAVPGVQPAAVGSPSYFLRAAWMDMKTCPAASLPLASEARS